MHPKRFLDNNLKEQVGKLSVLERKRVFERCYKGSDQ